MAKDVVTFLHWAAEPEHDERKKIGLKAVILFSALTAISLYVKRAKWAGIKTRKICAYKSNSSFASSPADFFCQYILPRLTNTISLLVLDVNYFVANTNQHSSTLCEPWGYLWYRNTIPYHHSIGRFVTKITRVTKGPDLESFVGRVWVSGHGGRSYPKKSGRGHLPWRRELQAMPTPPRVAPVLTLREGVWRA